ncbi:hypothetical protein K6W37_03350 [Acetobacter senegalensis]|uniref:hypothetical protein n=1 Tax=Acetobacter senegalensis TaxID=446692 RepID=UPI001EDACFE4|nr:hypothetical protein [Acetobacter senegalensis]MCG4252940.1 hypothetical protein [Acetobacter senegalensis]
MATVKITPTPTTLIYSYIIAHGMARGRVMSGDLAPQDVIRLEEIDHKMLLTVIYANKNFSEENFRKAASMMVAFLSAIE